MSSGAIIATLIMGVAIIAIIVLAVKEEMQARKNSKQ
jgi:hypothetical protein